MNKSDMGSASLNDVQKSDDGMAVIEGVGDGVPHVARTKKPARKSYMVDEVMKDKGVLQPPVNKIFS